MLPSDLCDFDHLFISRAIGVMGGMLQSRRKRQVRIRAVAVGHL